MEFGAKCEIYIKQVPVKRKSPEKNQAAFLSYRRKKNGACENFYNRVKKLRTKRTKRANSMENSRFFGA